eukprot:augustus_masked-scaffold_1-processed-gene-0.6-mRNA-1 protein AED:1.00 eAED:1.00 QI:0/-1/0/0/-1/1/1/0/255
MQAAPTIGSIFVDSIDDCKEHLDTRVIPYAQYCPDWVPNITSNVYRSLTLSQGFVRGLPKQFMNTFLVYLTHEIEQKLGGRNKRKEIFSVVLVWLGHIVQVVVKSDHAPALKNLCVNYAMDSIEALELTTANIQLPTPVEYMKYFQTKLAWTTISHLQPEDRIEVDQIINNSGAIEIYLHESTHPYLIAAYWESLREDEGLNLNTKTHGEFAQCLETLLMGIPDPEGVNDEDDDEDLFTKGMNFLVEANKLGVDV